LDDATFTWYLTGPEKATSEGTIKETTVFWFTPLTYQSGFTFSAPLSITGVDFQDGSPEEVSYYPAEERDFGVLYSAEELLWAFPPGRCNSHLVDHNCPVRPYVFATRLWIRQNLLRNMGSDDHPQTAKFISDLQQLFAERTLETFDPEMIKARARVLRNWGEEYVINPDDFHQRSTGSTSVAPAVAEDEFPALPRRSRPKDKNVHARNDLTFF